MNGRVNSTGMWRFQKTQEVASLPSLAPKQPFDERRVSVPRVWWAPSSSAPPADALHCLHSQLVQACWGC